jgi:TPR repeat protein
MDSSKAVKGTAVLRSLAEAGDAEAQFRLAQAYENGQGVAQGYADAARWYQAAAEQGILAAQARLGEMYLCGCGHPESITPSAAAHLAEASEEQSAVRRLFPNGCRRGRPLE